ncbi:uncharacterized protein LOC113363062 [Ctenocephalides felis]|uniref:uncharacterized protein LOC113363062 n=1 Tax=Ctenocephalides felis TaxID=7515 RepID=UPI000E6E5BDD|nr:uncharacterized protein LOC113363062 [Ctenocephalides felis]
MDKGEGQVSHVLGTVLKLSGWLGICQSIAWFILSVLVISSYFCAFEFLDVVANGDSFSQAAFVFFFDSSCSGIPPIIPDLETSPQSYTIIMFFFLFSTIVWFVASIMLLVQKGSDNTIGKPIKFFWSFLTLFICTLDLALAVMFGMNYQYFKDHSIMNQTNFGTYVSAIFVGIAMRGFVLWIINAGCALYILTRAMTNVKENTKSYPQQNYSGAHLDAYDNQSPQGYNNNAYDWSDRPNEPIKPSPLNPPFSPRSHQDDRGSNLNYPVSNPNSPGYGTPPPVLPKPAVVGNTRFARKPTPTQTTDYDNPATRYGSRMPVIPQPDYDAQGLPRAHLRPVTAQPYNYGNRAREQY